MSERKRRRRKPAEATLVRLRIPSRSRPGLLHEVILRTSYSGLTTACSCEDSCFSGPEKRGDPWCWHTGQALELAGEALGIRHAVPAFDPDTGEVISSAPLAAEEPELAPRPVQRRARPPGLVESYLDRVAVWSEEAWRATPAPEVTTDEAGVVSTRFARPPADLPPRPEPTPEERAAMEERLELLFARYGA